MLLNREKSFLLAINLQKHLLPMVHEPQKFIDSNILLIKFMKKLGVPTLLTLHKGLGDALSEAVELVEKDEFVEKTFFSCLKENQISEKINSLDQQSNLIITGMEAHACVMQTAIDVKQSTKMSVYVVEDAITARSFDDKKAAIERMRDMGISIITKEMVLFEFARRTDNDIYKTIMEIAFKKA